MKNKKNYTDFNTEDEKDIKNFHPRPKQPSIQIIRQTTLLYLIIFSIGVMFAILCQLDALSIDKQWMFFMLAVPSLIILFDTLNICFPFGDISYEILAASFKAYGKIKAIKRICIAISTYIIVCAIIFKTTYGFHSKHVFPILGIIALAWFLTGIIRFFRIH